MSKSIKNEKEQIINKLISEKLPNHSEEDKNLAKQQLEDFIDLASSIIINNQLRFNGLEG